MTSRPPDHQPMIAQDAIATSTSRANCSIGRSSRIAPARSDSEAGQAGAAVTSTINTSANTNHRHPRS